jgi:hypothetical protein
MLLGFGSAAGIFAKKFSFQNSVSNQSLDPAEQGFCALQICLHFPEKRPAG